MSRSRRRTAIRTLRCLATLGAPVPVVAAVLGIATGCGSGGGGVTTPDPSTRVDSVFVSLDSTSLIIGDTVSLVAVARNAAGQPVSGVVFLWTSSDPAVATVSTSGLVTAVGFGEAEIDVDVSGASLTSGSNKASARLSGSRRSRVKFQSVPTIVITPGSTTVDIGENVPYTARLVDKFNTQLSRYPVIIWTSSAPAVATIDQGGRATAVGKGTTSIGAAVSFVSGNSALPARVPLQVAVCGGMLDLSTWTATLATSYSVVNKVILRENGTQELTFNVSQSSQGTASLHRTYLDTQTSETRWEGVVTGTASVQNKVAQRDFIPDVGWVSAPDATDTRSGPLSFLYALVKLRGLWTQENGCKYTLTYEDGGGYTHTDSDGSYTVDISAAVVQFLDATGPKPAGGWRLTGSPDLPAMLVDLTTEDPAELGLINVFYSPFPPIPESMLLLNGSPTFGTGKFTFTLVGQ